MSSAQDHPAGPVRGVPSAGRDASPEQPQPPPRGASRDEPAAPSAATDPDRSASARVAAELARLAAAIEREHERAAHREAVIDRLHQDVQTLRRGELHAMFDPVRAVLFRLHDLTAREARRWAEDPPDAVHAAALLAAIRDEIAEALARTGAERFVTRPGDRYDPVRHRPIDIEPVADPALDGTIVSVCADGFERAGRVIRKAEVRVGRHRAPDADGDDGDPAARSSPLPRSSSSNR
ncbi:nucleotide exchange factor GrpE [Thermomonospora catenispora]|uniref:nucleotide exchange factor GrpE n=1 Tax=Thermomonospora catenispora TaxID=2493090 RepID=UPI001F4FED56|nr:nucleotide exchange factor GrpE [Thermomonospora catenispora]